MIINILIWMCLSTRLHLPENKEGRGNIRNPMTKVHFRFLSFITFCCLLHMMDSAMTALSRVDVNALYVFKVETHYQPFKLWRWEKCRRAVKRDTAKGLPRRAVSVSFSELSLPKWNLDPLLSRLCGYFRSVSSISVRPFKATDKQSKQEASAPAQS